MLSVPLTVAQAANALCFVVMGWFAHINPSFISSLVPLFGRYAPVSWLEHHRGCGSAGAFLTLTQAAEKSDLLGLMCSEPLL